METSGGYERVNSKEWLSPCVQLLGRVMTKLSTETKRTIEKSLTKGLCRTNNIGLSLQVCQVVYFQLTYQISNCLIEDSMSASTLYLIVDKLQKLCPSSPQNTKSVQIQEKVLRMLGRVLSKIGRTLSSKESEAAKKQRERIASDVFDMISFFVRSRTKNPERFPPELSATLVDVIEIALRSNLPDNITIDEAIEVFLDLLGDNDTKVRCKISESIKVMFDIFPSHVELFSDMAHRLPQGMLRDDSRTDYLKLWNT